MSAVWHYSRNGQRHGPVTAAELKQLAATGRLSPDDKVWKEGMEKWVPARTVKGLFTPAAATVQQEHVADKIKAVSPAPLPRQGDEEATAADAPRSTP